MPCPPVSVTIITLNEEKNLARALRSVSWANEILVIDSGSKDQTQAIAKQQGARVIERSWEGYGQQKNFAQSQVKNDWVLNIDADEEVSVELRDQILYAIEEVDRLKKPVRGFKIPRKTFYLGRWILHGGWYPNYLCRLVDRRYAKWSQPEVHEDLCVDGSTELLTAPIHHYSFECIQDQIRTNLNFSWLGFKQLKSNGKKPSLSLLILKPLSKFFETYVFKRGFMDGLPGFIISINAAHSAFLKYAYLFESQITEKRP